MLLPGVFSTQEQKQVSGITEESPRSPESPIATFCWLGARISDQAVKAADVAGVGGGRQIPETAAAFPTLPSPPFLRSPYEHSIAPHLPKVTQPDTGTAADNPRSQCQALPPRLLHYPADITQILRQTAIP